MTGQTISQYRYFHDVAADGNLPRSAIHLMLNWTAGPAR